MPFLRILCLLGLGLAAFAAPERGNGSLEYRVKLRFRSDAAAIETRFTLVPTPIAATANRVKKARLGGWRLEAPQPKEATFSLALVLARVERMLYFSGPEAQTHPRNVVVRFGDKPCRIWSVDMPAGVSAYAYLAEVAPGLLALNYFSGSFAHGDLASLEIQLQGFQLDASAAPAEEGTVLLRSLAALGSTGRASQEEGSTQIVH